jgi:hypothetical protein
MSVVTEILLYIVFFAIIYVAIFGIRSVYVVIKKVYRFFSERVPLLIDSIVDFVIKHAIVLLLTLLVLVVLILELCRIAIFAYLLNHL